MVLQYSLLTTTLLMSRYDYRRHSRTYSFFPFTYATILNYTPYTRSPLILRLNDSINTSLRKRFTESRVFVLVRRP
jgi:hypothetical protein